MQRLARTLLLSALALGIALPVGAAQKEKKKPAKKADPAAGVLKRLEAAELTADQITKVKELVAKHAEGLKAAQDKVNLTAEQKQARSEATKKAQAEGKKGKDLQAAVDAAAKLSDEQKVALKKVQELQGAMMKEVHGLLSDEQKAKLGLKVGGKKK